MLHLSKAYALASASEEARELRDEVGFFQAVRAALVTPSLLFGGVERWILDLLSSVDRRSIDWHSVVHTQPHWADPDMRRMVADPDYLAIRVYDRVHPADPICAGNFNWGAASFALGTPALIALLRRDAALRPIAIGLTASLLTGRAPRA